MISEKLILETQNITKILNHYTGFTDALQSISSIQTVSLASLKKILDTNSGQDTVNAKETAKGQIHNLAYNAARKEKFRNIHSALRELSDSLSNSKIEILQDTEKLVDQFTDSFDNYLHSTNLSTTFSLIEDAHRLHTKLQEIISLEETLSNNLQAPSENPTLKIYIPESLSLLLFGQKIQALAEILDICCQILSEKVEEKEIFIEKVESGSLFAKISAHPLVIALATIIITHGSQYVFERFDSSTDLDNLKDATEIIEKNLKIREFLNSNNIETHEFDEELKKSSVQIIKQLGRLMKDTNEIEVNDKLIQSKNNNLSLTSTTRSIEHKSKSKKQN